MSEAFDVVVIGGGTAGLVTASGCARLGRRVALIERRALGGECLWTGCVPTKALVATARLAHQMRQASAWGLEPVEPRIDPKAILQSMREVRQLVGIHDDPEKFRNLGIEVIEGTARLASTASVEVNGCTLRAKDIVIATGSRTAVPPVDGLAKAGFLDHVSFLAGDAFPKSVLILGGGATGVEFAQLFRRFGSKVVVVELSDEILNREDVDIIAGIRRTLEGEGVEIRAGWAARAVRSERETKIVQLEMKNGESREVDVDEIFIASGRRGNIEELGLEAAGVKTERGFITVNKYLQTSAPRIWACGDVHGGLQFTHVAAYEAVKLVRNMLFPGKSAVDSADIPWAVYTDPEAAHIGMTEREAREAIGDDTRIYKVDMKDVDRAIVDRRKDGFLKFICDPKGWILGAHALCPDASTLIEEIVLARKKGMRIGRLAQIVSPYPSLADAVQRAASDYYRNIGAGRRGSLARRLAAWSQ